MKIIGFVGLPGSGKSVACQVARDMGLPVAVMGDVIRQEARSRGLLPTDANHGMVGDDLRSSEGPEAVARRCLIGQKGNVSGLVVVDGIRSKSEVDYFRSIAEKFCLVEIRTCPEDRLRRIAARGRSDDGVVPNGPNEGPEILPESQRIFSPCQSDLRVAAEALEKRECRELGWGMHQATREADICLDNDGSVDDLRRKVRDILLRFC
ncbi:MAG TPA: AAA family ATPase [Methanothrix soehngenii]|mgnify:CR=1 FL=1|nr:AAA family ATPase [Methanotrichaceae archaeon]HQF16424.1 AAA family ATPase [Methanotrichaceae archaeon]HQI53777.1 AAA family ATPase [Methanothrix soehngenii]HQI91182.1 AAA family ATPase [Methanotrichaceae archaeon]HQJ28405.1 AAA family ATPase [Methanotrichaceae archaeon]